MATVPNKDGAPVSGSGRMTDPSYSLVSRTNAGTPMGALIPAFVDELVMDTTNGQLYRATGTLNNQWFAVTRTH